MQNGIKNLEKVNYKVDYIVTHCCPTSIQTLLNPSYKKDILTNYLQKISESSNLNNQKVNWQDIPIDKAIEIVIEYIGSLEKILI